MHRSQSLARNIFFNNVYRPIELKLEYKSPGPGDYFYNEQTTFDKDNGVTFATTKRPDNLKHYLYKHGPAKYNN